MKKGDKVEMVGSLLVDYPTKFTTGVVLGFGVDRIGYEYVCVKRDGYRGHESTHWPKDAWRKAKEWYITTDDCKKDDCKKNSSSAKSFVFPTPNDLPYSCTKIKKVSDDKLKKSKMFFKILKETPVSYVKLDISMDDELKQLLCDYADINISDEKRENLLVEWAIIDIIEKSLIDLKREENKLCTK